ncbi:MAG TPA: hypothetical protein VFQ53_20510 [Kofleriaceae bacterium]|nr:hypothetical protein [Kofleriaceae bacterium]
MSSPDDDKEVKAPDASPPDPSIELAEAIEVVEERKTPAPLPRLPTASAAPEPRRRPVTRSIPPPIPQRARRPTLPQLVTSAPETPTVLDGAIAMASTVDHKVRAERAAKELETLASTDRPRAASVAYELGELYETRLGDEPRALETFRRAHELDPALQPARWALRRVLYKRGLAAHLVQLIDGELGRTTDATERADLTLERAVIPGGLVDRESRLLLDAAGKAAPRHLGLLFELERVLAHTGPPAALLDVLERLATAVEQPSYQVAYWLEAARVAAAVDKGRSRKAFEAALQLAPASGRERIARERLHLAEQHGGAPEVAAALEALVQTLIDIPDPSPHRAMAKRRELVALYRWQAQLPTTPPERAWTLLQHALALAPDEPLVVVDLVEHAGKHGIHDQLPELVRAWYAVEKQDAARATMLGWWTAHARDPDRRAWSQAVLDALAVTTPGLVTLTAITEADALVDVAHVRGQLELADTYMTMARAALVGSWTGPGLPPSPDPRAAAALYIQAAELLAYHVETPTCVDQARDALREASVTAPDSPALVEATIELDERKGDGTQAVARLVELANATPDAPDRAIVERAIRVAYQHDITETVVTLHRELLARTPNDSALTWRLDAILGQLGRDPERRELLDALVGDADAARRRTALLEAAVQHERAGSRDAALEHYRRLLAVAPDEHFARESLIELLRAQERWEELVAERRAHAKLSTDDATLRRAWREAAWVLEIKLDDPTRAREVYGEWLARMPEDRTALAGSARCSRKLDDIAAEVPVREVIARVDPAPDTQWMLARSLERSGKLDDAAAQYRALADHEDVSVAVAGAAYALHELAVRGDLAARAEAAAVLAKRTTDPGLSATLHEQIGWTSLLALDDRERAATAFGVALEQDPERLGAWLGTALVAACQLDPARLGDAGARLATAPQQAPDVTAALYLQAAACAAAAGDLELANERVEAARLAAPDDIHVLVVAAETEPPRGTDTADPFAAVEALLTRAELFARRAGLVDDPAGRATWQLDRAEALELAGQLSDAGEVVIEVLRAHPEHRRALAMFRRIAQRAGDTVSWAHASYALARLTRDPAGKLRLLRDAAGVYDRPGQPNAKFALAAYRRILGIDAGAPEIDRLLELLRETDDTPALVAMLSKRLEWLQRSDTPAAMIPLLFERATALRKLARGPEAALDLEVLLGLEPDHVDAIRLRAEIALDQGDLRRAVALLRRCAALETTTTRRIEIESLLATALEATAAAISSDRKGGPWTGPEESTTSVRAIEDTTHTQENDFTDAEVLVQQLPDDAIAPITHRPSSPHVIRRPSAEMRAESPPPGDVFGGETVVGDPFGANTALADISQLQESERRVARTTIPRMLAVQPPIVERTITNTDARASADEPFAGVATLTDIAPPPVEAETRPVKPPEAEPTKPVPSGEAEPTNPVPAVAPPAAPVIPIAIAPTELAPVVAAVPAAIPPAVVEPTGATLEVEPVLDPRELHFPEAQEASDSEVVMLSYDQLQPQRLDASDDMVLELEREIAVVDDPVLRIEAGRLCEQLGAAERARTHYEAALVADPRATAALRGLRRIAWTSADLVEATRLLDAEIVVAGSRERDALARYRVDLLLATGEHDLARVAVGELLDRSPDDVPALFAYLALALIDHRTDELATTLERLIGPQPALHDPALRATIERARGVLAEHRGEAEIAARWFGAAAASDPGALASQLYRLREIVRASEPRASELAPAWIELACNIEKDDPVLAAALAVRAQSYPAALVDAETRETAAQLAARAAPRDPLAARFAAETAATTGDVALASHAFARWVRCKSSAIDRAYAAGRAAELEPQRLGRLWGQVLELDPRDDYASARLRAVHVEAGELWLAHQLDREIAETSGRDRPLIRTAWEQLAADQLEPAITLLMQRLERGPAPVIVALTLAEAFARAGRWTDRAKLLRDLGDKPGPLARDVVRLRSALAWDKAARLDASSREDHDRATAAALDAWDLVIEHDKRSPFAHGAAIAVASRLPDVRILERVLDRARAVEQSPWYAASLGMRQARLVARAEPQKAQDIARAAANGLDDPRATLAVMIAAAHAGKLGEAAIALEQRAVALEAGPKPATPRTEPIQLRVRAAQLALDANDLPRAKALLAQVERARPGLVDDLREVARRRAGEPASKTRSEAQSSSLARVVRDADLAAAAGDRRAALALYREGVERWYADPLAAVPLLRLATEQKEADLIASVAQERLRSASELGDPILEADAHELLARVARELRKDAATARAARETAFTADPNRLDLALQLEREHGADRRYKELLALRDRRLEHDAGKPITEVARERVALLLDTATIALRAKRSDDDLAKLYRGALAIEPEHRIAMFQLEALLRRSPPSDELVALEDRIAAWSEDPRAKAAALTRAGELLAKLGKPAEAVQRFTRAADVVPTYHAALDAWHDTALAAGLWVELAEVATRKAALERDPETIASLHHFAGVTLMDKAQAKQPAIAALGRALAAEPRHLDAFLRLRILLEDTADHDGYATLLRNRLEHEQDRTAKIELNRMLAEHGRTVDDRDLAMRHYRAILALDPADARAHAAIADLQSDPGHWQDAGEAILARIRLERDPSVLRTLHYRLGSLYAEHDRARAIAAFQRALTFKPDDDAALSRLVDLAIDAGQWQVALDACDQLVAKERDHDKLAAHLQRASLIFARGLGDKQRAEKMLVLALESAPTSTAALELLIELYRDGDAAALRPHLDRIVDQMRARIASDPRDGAAYRMLAQALAARDTAIQDGSLAIARNAAEVARVLGTADGLDASLGTVHASADLARLAAIEDELFAGAGEPAMRRLLRLLAEPIAKHVGVDLGAYGVGRKDRLRPQDPIAIVAREIATALGLKDVDVYVSTVRPYAAISEPTHPVSLVLGSAIATGDPVGVRFAAGTALKLAQLSLSVPSRMVPQELGVLGLTLLRVFQPELTIPGIDDDAVPAQLAKLRRSIPTGLVNEARATALAISTFNPLHLARDLKIAGLRAGLLASGHLVPGIASLAAAVDIDLPSLLADPIARGTITFALAEDRLASRRVRIG